MLMTTRMLLARMVCMVRVMCSTMWLMMRRCAAGMYTYDVVYDDAVVHVS